MSKAIGLAVLVTVLFFGGIFLFGYIGFQNDAARFENALSAQLEDNKNLYDNGWKEVKEMAQVPKLQEAALEKLYVAALKERNYGGEVVKFIQENNPNLDQTTFIKIQTSIEKFRSRFAQAQTEIISKKQAYSNFLAATTSGRFYNAVAGVLGGRYPRVDMSQFIIVTSEQTDADFKVHMSEPLKLE
jgi:hypothetical protein